MIIAAISSGIIASYIYFGAIQLMYQETQAILEEHAANQENGGGDASISDTPSAASVSSQAERQPASYANRNTKKTFRSMRRHGSSTGFPNDMDNNNQLNEPSAPDGHRPK